MTDTTETRFRRELNSFFAVTLLNVVFAAQAIALGMAYVVASVLGTTEVPTDRPFGRSPAPSPWSPSASGSRGSVRARSSCGASRSSAGRSGAGEARRARRTSPRGIVGMVAHYRENRATIRTMILVCTVGGFFFLAQGVVSAVEFASFTLSGGNVTLNGFALLPSALLSLGIGLVSLLSSYYFTRFSRSWDLRLEETARAEERLKSAMEMETE